MTKAGRKDAAIAAQIRVRGIVQGVGFRPFVHRLARERGLDGDVWNDGDGVCIRLGGRESAIGDFLAALRAELPPLARIDEIERSAVRGPLPVGFRIVHSRRGPAERGGPAIAPDTATCAECRSEIFDPADRRYGYAFTNCTNCGPRLTILRETPYDRANTSMALFPMCGECQREYGDMADRRFHAQPNACPACGPQLWLERLGGRAGGRINERDPIRVVREALHRGAIVALKGLGGFHLACRALDEAAVSRMRRRKRRSAKPFALMARDVAAVSRFCRVSPDERALLESPEAPIVLLAATGAERVAASVAPQQRTLGFMLPYTPLHHLLLAESDEPLVMTSGNLSDEPQVIDDGEARAKLGGIAELMLTHDRAIVNRVDDSVVRVVAGRPRQVRRARGFAPAPLALPDGFAAASEVLALGAQLKATFCSARGAQAVISQHLGDLDDAAAFAAYRAAMDLYLRLGDGSPKALAVDLHPDMMSTKLGEELAAANGLPLFRVQHHHAHAASCMAENGIPLEAAPTLALVFDGLGYGPDGSFWGGEFLLADYAGFRRVGAFKPVAMPGGERAIREPWRMALAYLRQTFDWSEIVGRYGALPFVRSLAGKPVDALERLLAHGVNCPMTTSCGRLFDAVAAIAGVREAVTYEGQAAIELEAALTETGGGEAAYPLAVIPAGADDVAVIDPAPMWRRLLDDLADGATPGLVAARFHLGLVQASADMVVQLVARHGRPPGDRIALSGGVFQNAFLLEGLTARLQSMGYRVISHAYVPSNDGGIALGQAAVCAARMLGREFRCASACPARS